jgi:hypothetical protein
LNNAYLALLLKFGFDPARTSVAHVGVEGRSLFGIVLENRAFEKKKKLDFQAFFNSVFLAFLRAKKSM